jgi:hypothetical protein
MKTYIFTMLVVLIVFAVVGAAMYHLFKVNVVDQLAAVNSVIK